MVTGFLFLGSEETIDAPRVSDGDLPVVRVVGGAPPPSGPVKLEFARGARARFRLVTDAPTVIEVRGYGIRRKVEESLVFTFRASQGGRFPVVAGGSDVAVASLRVSPRAGSAGSP